MGIVQKTYTISHDSDGTKTISLSGTGGISGTSFTSTSLSGTATLTSLDRTAPTITISSYSSANNAITIAATSSASCNTWQYSTNGGSSYTTFNSGSATSVSTTISGLSANTTYSVRIRAYKVANNISSYASASITTLGASSITSASSVTLSSSGTACSIKFTPYSTSYYYTLKFVVGSKTVTTSRFCPGTTSAYTYTGYSFDLETWAPYITSATSATCTATLTTYASSSTSTAMGTSSKTFTVSVPSSVVPVINSVSFTEAAEDFPEAFEGVYVQGVSQLAITVDAEGIYSSTISAIAAKFEGTTYDATDGATTDTITGSGDISIAVTITDSRGRTASGTYAVEVVEYYAPTLYLSYSTTSSTLAVIASGGVAEVDGLNSATLTYHVEETSDSSVYYDAEIDIETGSYSETYGITDDSAQTVTWSITVTVTDALSSTTVTKTTGVTALSFLAGGKGAAFFQEAEEEGLVVAGNTDIEGALQVGEEAYIANSCTVTATGEEDEEGNGTAAYVRAYNSGADAQAEIRANVGGNAGLYSNGWILYRDADGYDHFSEDVASGSTDDKSFQAYQILPHIWVGTGVWVAGGGTSVELFSDDEISEYFSTGNTYSHLYTYIGANNGDGSAQNAHVDDTTYLSGGWYATLSEAVSGNIRINYIIVRY